MTTHVMCRYIDFCVYSIKMIIKYFGSAHYNNEHTTVHVLYVSLSQVTTNSCTCQHISKQCDYSNAIFAVGYQSKLDIKSGILLLK